MPLHIFYYYLLPWHRTVIVVCIILLISKKQWQITLCVIESPKLSRNKYTIEGEAEEGNLKEQMIFYYMCQNPVPGERGQ
jgi:hypothetical protein